MVIWKRLSAMSNSTHNDTFADIQWNNIATVTWLIWVLGNGTKASVLVALAYNLGEWFMTAAKEPLF